MNQDHQQQVDNLLAAMQPGVSQVSASAYDTAWLARLSARFPEFEKAVDWLRQNQHTDGSWGAQVLFYHDRIIATLTAIWALDEVGTRPTDRERIKAGVRFIQRNADNLHRDYHDTVGAPMLLPFLAEQVRRRGYQVPKALLDMQPVVKHKMQRLLDHPEYMAYSSALFSLEAFLPELYQNAPTLDLASPSGCVGGSPSATIASVYYKPEPNAQSLAYLRGLMAADGSVPAAVMELTEMSFALEVLLDAGVVTPAHPDVQRIAAYLYQHWDNQAGIGFYPGLPIVDLDDTNTTFYLLRACGYPVDALVFAAYEGDDYFFCYRGELDPSLMVNVRLLTSLRYVADDMPLKRRWLYKINALLEEESRNNQPIMWTDKWHTSPYYVTNKVVSTLHGTMDHIITPHIDWLLQTQRDDGGWGWAFTTQEETAYAIMALMTWATANPNATLQAAIKRGGDYLRHSVDDTHYPRLWITKSLYAPEFMIRAAIVAARQKYAIFSGEVRHRETDNR